MAPTSVSEGNVGCETEMMTNTASKTAQHFIKVTQSDSLRQLQTKLDTIEAQGVSRMY